MQNHRINELISLIHSAWLKESNMNLIPFFKKLSIEAGLNDNLESLTDEILIYHLKMRNSNKKAMISRIKKNYEKDFKTAILKVSGINKD